MEKNINNSLMLSENYANKDNKSKNLCRTTSDGLAVTLFNSNLKKGNVIIIDGLKYRFNGEDMLFIDKNAKKSADVQGKQYKEVIRLESRKRILEKMKSEGREEEERRPCTIVKVLSNQIQLRPASLTSREAKNFTITEACFGRYYSHFYVGQKVNHITFKRTRPATEEEREWARKRWGEELYRTTDWNHVTIPLGVDEDI